MAEIIEAEVLHPEGGVLEFDVSQKKIDGFSQADDGTLAVERSNGKTESYPEHRVHKVVRKGLKAVGRIENTNEEDEVKA